MQLGIRRTSTTRYVHPLVYDSK